MKFVLFVVSIAILCTSAVAGEIRNAKIIQVEHGPIYGNLVYVMVEGTFDVADPRATCSVNPRYQFVFDTGNTAGLLLYSSVMLALKDGKTISISGTNTCLSGTDSESMRWLQVAAPPVVP